MVNPMADRVSGEVIQGLEIAEKNATSGPEEACLSDVRGVLEAWGLDAVLEALAGAADLARDADAVNGNVTARLTRLTSALLQAHKAIQ